MSYASKSKNQKVIQTVYLEYKPIMKAKANGLNISAICNEALIKAVMK